MPRFGKIIACIAVFAAFAYAASILNHQNLLKGIKDKDLLAIRKNFRHKVCTINTRLILLQDPIVFLEELKFTDNDTFFVIWNSFKYTTRLPLLADAIFKVVHCEEMGKMIFEKIKENYKKYLYQKFFELSAKNQEEIAHYQDTLITQAMALYFFKFQLFWRLIMKPRSYKFDPTLNHTFEFLQASIGGSITELLKFEFSEFYRGFRKEDSRTMTVHRERFRLLVHSHSNDLGEPFWLLWVAKQKDPFFVLFYFFFRTADHPKKSTLCTPRKAKIGRLAFKNLRCIVDCRMNIVKGKVVFMKNFASRFPQISTVKLRTIMQKIALKIFETNWWVFKDMTLTFKYK